MQEKQLDVYMIKSGSDFIIDGYKSLGYQTDTPYYEKGLLLRIVREIFFRLKLPLRRLWYKKNVLSYTGKNIIIFDPLVTVDYLEWMISSFEELGTEKNIIFFYNNMIGNARHIPPHKIPSEIEIWTYDKHDAKKYELNLNDRSIYFENYCQKPLLKEYDVLFIGRDKKRAECLLELEKKLNDAGLSTYFHIVGNTRFDLKKKSFYRPPIQYTEICKYISRSKAIINIGVENQDGLTIRDMEALFNNTKLITNNKNINKYDFYKKENIFILEVDDFEDIKNFVNSPYEEIDVSVLKKYQPSSWLKAILK